MSTELETSYGGVVVPGDEVLVIPPTGRTVTGLPKGGMEAGETPEQAAAREVREETGVVAAGREPLGDVRYTYRGRGGSRSARFVTHTGPGGGACARPAPSFSATTSRVRPPITTTRSTKRAGS